MALFLQHFSDLLSFQQIVRWLQYQYNVQRSKGGVYSKIADPNDPLTILIARLTGTKLTKPRKLVPHNLWFREPENKAKVDEEYTKQYGKGNGRLKINQYYGIISSLFKQLPLAERNRYAAMAVSEHKQLLQDHEDSLNSPPATDPESRQKYVVIILSTLPISFSL